MITRLLIILKSLVLLCCTFWSFITLYVSSGVILQLFFIALGAVIYKSGAKSLYEFNKRLAEKFIYFILKFSNQFVLVLVILFLAFLFYTLRLHVNFFFRTVLLVFPCTFYAVLCKEVFVLLRNSNTTIGAKPVLVFASTFFEKVENSFGPNAVIAVKHLSIIFGTTLTIGFSTGFFCFWPQYPLYTFVLFYCTSITGITLTDSLISAAGGGPFIYPLASPRVSLKYKLELMGVSPFDPRVKEFEAREKQNDSYRRTCFVTGIVTVVGVISCLLSSSW